MNFESLKNSKHISFAKEIYTSSFPLDERRDFDLVIEMECKDGFDFYVIKSSLEGEKPIGIISLWKFEDFVYIEHFAIDKSLRQKGYGSVVIKEILSKYSQPFIIEVEPPTNVEALKRINFYIKPNFLYLDICIHVQIVKKFIIKSSSLIIVLLICDLFLASAIVSHIPIVVLQT